MKQMRDFNGVMVGLVKEVEDPDGMGRILVEFPWMGGKNDGYWAPVATMMAGNGRGSWFMPEVGDEALVAFNQEEPNDPYIIGFLWNGEDKPASQHTRERVIKSKNGHALRFLDSTPTGGSKGAVILEDGHGNAIALSNGKITLKTAGVIELDARHVVFKFGNARRPVAPNTNIV